MIDLHLQNFFATLDFGSSTAGSKSQVPQVVVHKSTRALRLRDLLALPSVTYSLAFSSIQFSITSSSSAVVESELLTRANFDSMKGFVLCVSCFCTRQTRMSCAGCTIFVFAQDILSCAMSRVLSHVLIRVDFTRQKAVLQETFVLCNVFCNVSCLNKKWPENVRTPVVE